uniref:Cpp48 n=1 Tax=Campylobacter coli TaxID=195 RepID=Q69BD9_CAMCO|nr:cpp48 [Campylobacter coli]
MHLIKVHIYSYYYLLIVTINNKNFLIFINNIANNKIFLKGEDEIIYSRKT